MNKYYALETNEREADIYIFGDIVIPEYEWFESDTSGYSLANEIKDLDVDVINVHINSYGGHVSEGLAIHNTLKNHKAKVKTFCDGFACSAASVVFMAGEERIMNESSLLMIHNAWTYAAGNAEELRKEADDLETITQASVAAYMSRVNVTENELKEMLNAETWLLPDDAVEKGFATSVIAETQTGKAAASARQAVVKKLTQKGMTVDVRLADLPEFQKIVADMEAELEKLKQPDPEPDPEPQENKTLKFFNALMGGKE